MPLRTVNATRYVLPLREGGSLPGLIEADDLGTYVVKFRGAGQGRKSLVAEVVVGELARRLGLPVPELVEVELDPGLAPGEPDQEVQDLLRASAGRNLGMDYLPGSLTLDPAADLDTVVEPRFAARVLWLDALVLNVDRSWRNPNLLRWHGTPWLIDHGASLYFHHDWARAANVATRPYAVASEHVLLPVAGPVAEADAELARQVTREVLEEAAALVPDEWLSDEPGFDDAAAVRARYVDVLLARVEARSSWLPALEESRAARV
ncbi:HipA family kinase [Motilibacter aurantiacus]|uniref:HipA family kinase n=1 Tax=Motilibacter aurantiacus TaxID=2714955 RepID=UPI00140B2FC5|nr:HipA family kinase [Motilibacter aurantiacus]NHC45767.1 aminotransferase class I and II [Motilibacter aurantiacus]